MDKTRRPRCGGLRVRLGVALALLVGAAWAHAAPAGTPAARFGVELFVAPDGRGDRCSAARPCSIEGAKAAVRALKSNGRLPANGVAVTLRGGRYLRRSTLVFDERDSGEPGRPVVWRAAKRGTVRLVGGTVVTGWKPVGRDDPNGRRIHSSATLYAAPVRDAKLGELVQRGGKALGIEGPALPRNTGPLAELFHDGVAMRLGRWPKAGWNRAAPTGSKEDLINAGTPMPGRGWDAASRLAPENRPWVHVAPLEWDDEVQRVASVTGDRIAFAGRTNWGLTNPRWAALNLLEEVSDPGEYWIDRVKKIVYFRPPDDRNPDAGAETVVSSLATPILETDATSAHLEFRDLVLEASQQDLVLLDGNENALRGCTLRNAGGNGVTIGGTGHLVDGCVVHGVGDAGIVTIGRGVPGRRPSHGVTIQNCDIHDVGRLAYAWAAAVNLSGAAHVVRHNKLHDLRWSAIYLLSRGAVIELNDISATNGVGADGGAIYSADHRNARAEIRHNFFHHIPSYSQQTGEFGDVTGRNAIYLDSNEGPGATTGFRVCGNVFYRVGDGTARNRGIMNKGSRQVIENNLFVRGDIAFDEPFNGSSEFRHNQGWRNRNAKDITPWPWPPGNEADRDPGFLGEGQGNLATTPDGEIRVPVFTAPIPFRRIGIDRSRDESAARRPAAAPACAERAPDADVGSARPKHPR